VDDGGPGLGQVIRPRRPVEWDDPETAALLTVEPVEPDGFSVSAN
jgi:hypothetical protein